MEKQTIGKVLFHRLQRFFRTIADVVDANPGPQTAGLPARAETVLMVAYHGRELPAWIRESGVDGIAAPDLATAMQVVCEAEHSHGARFGYDQPRQPRQPVWTSLTEGKFCYMYH